MRRPLNNLRLLGVSVGAETRHLGSRSLLSRVYLFLFGSLEVGQRIRAMHLLSVLPKAASYSVLDVGCGAGTNLFALARTGRVRRALGIDISPEQVRLATTVLARTAIEGMEFKVANIEDDALGEFRADVAICIDAVGYFRSDSHALARIRSTMTETGTLVLHSPVSNPTRYFARATEDAQSQLYVRDWYSEAELKALVSAAGFKVVAVRPTFGPAAEIAYELLGTPSRSLPSFVRAVLLPIVSPLLRLDFLGSRNANGRLIIAKVDAIG